MQFLSFCIKFEAIARFHKISEDQKKHPHWIYRSNVGAFWYGVHENNHGIFIASIAEWAQSHSTPFGPTQTHLKTIASSLESPS
jgi:hypothetical protein